ncbi:reverse transcriptase [Fusarium oxysporum f. sp. phaseoli]
MGSETKAEGRGAAREKCAPVKAAYQARSTQMSLSTAQQQQRQRGALPDRVGNYAKKIDKALPGGHTRVLYDALKRRESGGPIGTRLGASPLLHA